MVVDDPEQGGTPGYGGGVPPVPDAIWRKFLDDTEQAIRASTPRELSAQERAAEVRPDPAHPQGKRRQIRRGVFSETGPGSLDAVGEVWEPEEVWTRPAWRDMDGPARRRRVGRVFHAVAAALLTAGLLCRASNDPGDPDGTPGEAASQQSEPLLPDGVPTETGLPSAPAYTGTPPPTPRTG
ncbi:hypothetical protein AB0N07_01965 [Streptomyces sp. NPDC051172]|uniref:hypothetical protein n=1 Tax=Streptomyces sp. NPDC051172 TaxID=3155796 RepID=UPI00341B0E87